MINEEIARKTLSLEVKAAKVTRKLLLALLKKMMKEAKKLGGLEKLVKVNGNEIKLKDMARKGQLEEIPVEEAELKELKKELNKYCVKFSVMKDKETSKYAVFFQAKDMKYLKNQENMSNEEILANEVLLANHLIAEKEKIIENLEPKAKYLDELVNNHLLTNFINTAKELHIPQKVFIQLLIDKELIYRDKKNRLLPYAKNNKGFFEVKEWCKEGSEAVGIQTFVTPKGRHCLLLLIGGEKTRDR